MAVASTWAWAILTLVLLGVGNCNCSKICIVGSGISGASAAHFLRKYSQERMEIHVFERNSAVGGRMAMVELGGDKFEAGGSIFHPKNLHTVQFTQLLGLQRKSSSDDADFGIWDGQKFVFKTYPSSGKVASFLNSLLLIWRYGTSLFKMKKYTSILLSKFLHFYDESRPIFYSVEEMLKWANLYDYTTQSLEAELVAAGLSSHLISELVTKKITRYMENITESEVAGFCVGGLLVVVALAVPKVDSFIANFQRSSLGICERCGGLKVVSCSKCKGLGKVNPRMFNLNNKTTFKLVDGKKDSFVPCQNCGAKGCFSCPKCVGG